MHCKFRKAGGEQRRLDLIDAVIAERNGKESRRIAVEETADNVVRNARERIEVERIPHVEMVAAAAAKHAIGPYKDGAPVHLSDVAKVTQSAENDKLGAWMNTTPAIILSVQRQPGANVIEVVDRVKALMPQLQASMPASVTIATLTDRTNTIRASVHDTQFELALAVGLVVLIIYLFLRNLPATVIPSLSIPISIVGTFGVMYLIGFSLDNLSLMALTIATGFVVDDAIVMIENIARYVEQGENPWTRP